MGAKDMIPSLVGKRFRQTDLLERVSGRTLFSDDVQPPGMLHARVLRSPIANARITSLDASAARQLEGVVAVLSAEDIPGVNRKGNFPGARDDQPVLAGSEVRAVGDAIVLVAAETDDLAREAIGLIKVEYQQRPIVTDPLEALEPGAVQVDPQGNVIFDSGYERGELETGLAQAAAVVEAIFQTQCAEHAYLETESGVAWLDPGGVIHIRCGTQMIENYRWVARTLGVAHNRVRIESPPVGGAFGGKVMVTVEPYLALAVQATGRPVRMTLSREESILSSTKRHPFIMRYTAAADAQGRLTALSGDIIGDAGAYAELSGIIGSYGVGLVTGPYRCQNVKVRFRMTLTHNPTSTAMRGVGNPQITFGLEGVLDSLAEELGMDPFELRRRNFLTKGERLTTGQPLEHAVLLPECWQAADHALDRVLAEPKAPAAGERLRKFLRARGHSANMTGYGRRHATFSQAYVNLQSDGSAEVLIGAPDLGSGQRSGYQQVAAAALGLPVERVLVRNSDTQTTPLVGMTAGSRQFLNSGNAVLRAAEPLAEKLRAKAAELLEASVEDIVLEDGRAYVAGSPNVVVSHPQLIARLGVLNSLGTFSFESSDYPGSDTANDAGWADYTFGSVAAEVQVDPLTGQITVLGLGDSHDVGKSVNPSLVDGQCEGGLVQGLGLALTEDCAVRNGRSEACDFATYLVPTATDVPPLGVANLESGEGLGPYGARGIGEPPNNTVVAAIASAVSKAIGVRVTTLPMTPEKVLTAIRTGRWPA